MGFTALVGDVLKFGKQPDNLVTSHLRMLRRQMGSFLGFGTCLKYKPIDVVEVEETDHEEFLSTSGTVGSGLVGLAVAGPLGGGLGGKKKEKTLAVKLNDGRTLLGVLTMKQARPIKTHPKVDAFKQKDAVA